MGMSDVYIEKIIKIGAVDGYCPYCGEEVRTLKCIVCGEKMIFDYCKVCKMVYCIDTSYWYDEDTKGFDKIS